ncbi:MAG: ABC transporter permease [Candidatus Gottesmanbacteria bacterium]
MEEFFEIVIVSFTSLRANKMRSILTMLGVIIGVSSVILLVSIGTGLQNYITRQLEDLGAKNLMVMPGRLGVGEGGQGGGVPGAGSAVSKFNMEQVKAIEKLDLVEFVMPYTENNGTMKYGKNTRITQVAGVSSDYPQVRNQKVVQGRFFNKSEENSSKKVALLGKTTATKLFEDEDPVGKKITISDGRFKVLGVLEEKGALAGVDMDDQVFIPATTALKQFDMDHFIAIWVQARYPERMAETKKEVEKILLKFLKEDEFTVLDTKSLLNTIASILGVLTIALGGIAAISLVVGGIGIANIMLVSVTERTREIGLRKAVGATPTIIMLQFLIEAVVLSIGGGIIGILLGGGSSLLLSKLLPTSVTLWSILIAFIVSALVGIIFGLFPALRASRLTPVDALRYE